MDMVGITHPDVEGIGGPVPREAAESYWVPEKGWSIVEPELAAASVALGTAVADLDSLKREELDMIAANLGLDPSSYSTKAEVTTAIRSHHAG